MQVGDLVRDIVDGEETPLAIGAIMTVKQSDGNAGLMCEVRWLHWSGGRLKRPHIWYWPERLEKICK